jgi:hypothetical protein
MTNVMRGLLFAAMLMGTVLSHASEPLQTFVLKEHLDHAWTNEIIQFEIAYDGAVHGNLTLLNTDGEAIPCQVTGLTQKNGLK